MARSLQPLVKFRAGSNGVDIGISRHHTVSVSNFQIVDHWMANF